MPLQQKGDFYFSGFPSSQRMEGGILEEKDNNNGQMLVSPVQSIFTPLGLEKNGLLVTPLRIIQTTLLRNKFEHRICFVDPEMINHNTKRANFSALEYYLTEKIPEIRKGLLKKLMCAYLGRDYVFDWELENVPFDVLEIYNENIVSYANKCYLDYSQRRFQEYIFKIENERRYLRVRNRVTGERSLKFLETRYSGSYCKRVEARMKYLSHKYKDRPSVLLTLTFDPKKFNNDKLLMAEIINKETNRFLTALRISFKRDGRIFPKFIRAPEFQKNGNPHEHLVFLGASRLIDWRKIAELWKNGFIYINRTHDNKKVRYPISYITKYITKTFANYNYENIQTQALVWINGMRSFSCSRGLISPLNCVGDGDWVADYMVICDRRESVLSEMSIICDREDVMFDPKLWANPPPICSGKYVISANGEEVVSTDSPFWYSFFTNEVV